ncbi:MAG: Gfo/Idh/MocA family oxidoreductase [Verrucomicrobiia bacterium]
MIRIALLSTAHLHVNSYAQEARNSQDVQIACVWDDDPARGEPVAKELGVPFDNDLARVLSRKDVDAVIVCSESSKHRTILVSAAHAHKHIFTEKPLTLTLAEADEVAREIKASSVKFMISLPQRSKSETLLLKKLIDDGTLGKIATARFRMGHGAALEKWFKNGSAWFGDERSAGPGALFDIACHTLDAMRWLLGEPASVLCKCVNFSGAYPIPDNGVVVVEFKNKAVGILDFSYVQGAGPSFWEVYGTEGTAVRDMPGHPPVTYIKRQTTDGFAPAWQRVRMPKPRPSALQQWFAAILRNEPTHITVDDARNLTQLLDAARASARENREVKL